MYITTKAQIEIPEEITDSCTSCRNNEVTLFLVNDPDHVPVVYHWLDGAEDMISVRAFYKCYTCGAVHQYDDKYRYANTDTDTEQE